jgi:uncharacterized protein (TIGR00251 family)
MSFVSEQGQCLVLRIYVQPGASDSSFAGDFDGRLKIRLKAPPVEGKANKELIRFMAKHLKLSKSSIGILRGETSRKKDLLIEGLDLETLLSKIHP